VKPLTIIIPNYNGAHLLERNMPSVINAAGQYSGTVSFLVVDDGSADTSLEVLRERFPEVAVVIHEKNLGFAEAVATGVRCAETELLFLLNSDVELHTGCLERLEPYFDDENTFSACPLMLEEDGSINRHSWNLRSFSRGYLKLVDWNIDRARSMRDQHLLPTLYSSGGSMMVSRAKFLALGGFHPLYKPFYGEDFDLGLRAWYRGWASYFEPGATLVHQSKGSIKDNFKRARVKQIRRRNRYFIEWAHTPLPRLLGSTLPYSLLQLLGEILLLDLVNLKGFAGALAGLPRVIEARRALDVGRIMTLDQTVEKVLGAYPST